MAAGMDQPVAALLDDLKQRGMLDDTLVVWSTEFGRSPATQGVKSPGRDHHPDAFTCFLAGAGVKPGLHYGATDEVGYFVAENPVTIYDFHATILHLLGFDHTTTDVLPQRHPAAADRRAWARRQRPVGIAE